MASQPVIPSDILTQVNTIPNVPVINHSIKVLQKRVLEAAVEGDIETLHECFEETPQSEWILLTEYRNPSDGTTPLYNASRHGHVFVVDALLSRGADVNGLTTKRKFSPLLTACDHGHWKVVELLLTHEQIEIDIRDVYGQTPLHFAAWKNEDVRIMWNLLRYGADPNARDRQWGLTPLHYVSKFRKGHVVEKLIVLLSYGAQLSCTIRDRQDRTPVYYFQQNDDPTFDFEQARRLLEKPKALPCDLVKNAFENIANIYAVSQLDHGEVSVLRNEKVELEKRVEQYERLQQKTQKQMIKMKEQLLQLRELQSLVSELQSENQKLKESANAAKRLAAEQVTVSPLTAGGPPSQIRSQRSRRNLGVSQTSSSSSSCGSDNGSSGSSHRIPVEEAASKVFELWFESEFNYSRNADWGRYFMNFKAHGLNDLRVVTSKEFTNRVATRDFLSECIGMTKMIHQRMFLAAVEMGDAKWTDFEKWLRYKVNLPQYCDAFGRESINKMNLMKPSIITHSVLRQMGIEKVGHRLLILEEIERCNTASEELISFTSPHPSVITDGMSVESASYVGQMYQDTSSPSTMITSPNLTNKSITPILSEEGETRESITGFADVAQEEMSRRTFIQRNSAEIPEDTFESKEPPRVTEDRRDPSHIRNRNIHRAQSEVQEHEEGSRGMKQRKRPATLSRRNFEEERPRGRSHGQSVESDRVHPTAMDAHNMFQTRMSSVSVTSQKRSTSSLNRVLSSHSLSDTDDDAVEEESITPIGKIYKFEELDRLSYRQIRLVAQELGVDLTQHITKDRVIDAILSKQAKAT